MAPKPEEKDLEGEKIGKEELSEKFKQILKSNGITDSVAEVIVKDAGLKGEGFSSLTQLITIKFEDTAKKPLNLFVKVETENESHTQMLEEMKAFEKEALFLTKYLNEATEMCKLKGHPDLIDFYPKCYYGDAKMIVLENLVMDKGYQMKDKDERQNFEDAKVALKTLAKHHAIAHAMIKENAGSENFFQKFPNLDHETYDKPTLVPVTQSCIESCINSNMKILEINDVPGAKETVEKLKQILDDKPMNKVLDALKISDEDKESNLMVLGHGDYWNNNMMYLLDKETKKTLHHVVIDFQITRYNSLSLDLTYYFFTSVQPHVRRSHLLELLTFYKDTLNEVTEQLGHPTNLTLDQVYGDYRKKVEYGFWLGFIMTIGPGMALYKDIDVGKMSIEDWPIVIEQLINKWIDENPEKGKETAEELVKLVKEYEQLKI